MAIQSFADKATQYLFETGRLKKKVKWSSIKRIVLRKLDMLHYADILDDLNSPPGNQLEKLRGDLKGYYSIRINDQWRIIFTWTPRGPGSVRIIDYH